MNNIQLTHDFLEFLMENYSVRLEMSKKDAILFEQLYPDLTERIEKENDD